MHGAPAGLLTTAGLPKPEFYRRKRLWCADDPQSLDALEKDPQTAIECWRKKPEELLNPETETETGAKKLTVSVWKEKDAVTGLSFEEASAKKGYLYQLIFRLTDEKGKIVRMEDQEITVTAEGAGVVVSLDSGDLSDNTSFAENTRKTFRGELVAYVRRTGEGEIRIKAETSLVMTRGNSVILLKDF